MESVSNADAERIGPAFSILGMLQTRAKTRTAIRAIASYVQPGMVEEEAVVLAKQVLADAGLARTWHPSRVRFGTNTTRAMKQSSAPGVTLNDNDIFFIDIAPQYGMWEGDGGETFVVGDDAEYLRCADDAKTLFHDVRRVWTTENLTGQDLYRYAARKAQEAGWVLNCDLPGHRISDFPHAAIYTGSLADFDQSPSAMRWILEIHLRHPSGEFGAFFEDMLLPDEYYVPR